MFSVPLSFKESLKYYEEDSEEEDEISDLNFEEKPLIYFNKDKNIFNPHFEKIKDLKKEKLLEQYLDQQLDLISVKNEYPSEIFSDNNSSKEFFDNLPDETESTDKEFIDGQQIVDHPMYTQKPIATETILDQRLTNIMIIDK
jgi:formate dehydrogenase maturation protein FdhE